jgi:hypothetical protein
VVIVVLSKRKPAARKDKIVLCGHQLPIGALSIEDTGDHKAERPGLFAREGVEVPIMLGRRSIST